MAVQEALDPAHRNRAHLARLHDKPAAILKIGRPNQGYCETCQSYQPAPKSRVKGWQCCNCEKKQSKKPEEIQCL